MSMGDDIYDVNRDMATAFEVLKLAKDDLQHWNRRDGCWNSEAPEDLVCTKVGRFSSRRPAERMLQHLEAKADGNHVYVVAPCRMHRTELQDWLRGRKYDDPR